MDAGRRNRRRVNESSPLKGAEKSTQTQVFLPQVCKFRSKRRPHTYRMPSAAVANGQRRDLPGRPVKTEERLEHFRARRLIDGVQDDVVNVT